MFDPKTPDRRSTFLNNCLAVIYKITLGYFQGTCTAAWRQPQFTWLQTFKKDYVRVRLNSAWSLDLIRSPHVSGSRKQCHSSQTHVELSPDRANMCLRETSQTLTNCSLSSHLCFLAHRIRLLHFPLCWSAVMRLAFTLCHQSWFTTLWLEIKHGVSNCFVCFF